MDISSILEIERKYNLYSDEIDGVAYWMYLRFWIIQCTVISSITGNAPGHYNKGESKLRRHWNDVLCSLKNFKTGSEHADVLIKAHPRRTKIDGKYFEIYSDWLAQEYDAVSVIDNHFLEGELASPHPVFYSNFSLWVKKFLHKHLSRIFCRKKMQRIRAEVEAHLKRPLEEIASAYNITLDFEEICRGVTGFILSYKIDFDYFSGLIKKFKPKVVIIVVHYGGPSMFMCEAARKLGIPVVELQHGTMHPEHTSYHYNTDAELTQLPNYVFTFSDYWHDCMHMPAKSTKLITTGFPYFDEQRERFRNQAKPSSHKIILFLSQGTIGGKLSWFAADLSGRIDHERFRIIYKLHPGDIYMWRERYPELSEAEQAGRLEVAEDVNKSIYSYFAISSIQVGVYSTAVYEGLGFGLETYLYNISHASALSGLVDKGYARYVNDAGEMLEFLEHPGSSGAAKTSDFWCPNAKENIKRELDRIISQA